jgi:hypothetical protein
MCTSDLSFEISIYTLKIVIVLFKSTMSSDLCMRIHLTNSSRPYHSQDIIANGEVTGILEVEENVNERLVATLEGVDEDRYTKFIYFLADNADGKFSIDPGTDKLKVK